MKANSRIAQFFKPVDMTTGSPVKRIAQFAVPMLIGNIIQQLYSTVDSIVVGKYVGDNALAAVGSVTPIYNLLLVLFVGVSVGATIMVSRYTGAKNRESLSKSVGSGIFLTFFSSLALMIIGPLLARPILSLLGTPESIIDWCESYLTILTVGIMGMSYYNILSGMLRGLGDALSALMYLVVACVLNIVLDLWFVAGLKMEGVSGVALATVIAQLVSAVLCAIKLSKMKDFFDLKWKYVRLNGAFSKDILKLGMPSGLSQMLFSLAMVVVQSLTNSFGEMVIAANVIIMRVDGFAMMPNLSFGTAMTTYAGQNLGANKIDRVYKGAKSGTLMTMGVSGVLVALILIFGKYLMGMFTDTEELVQLANHCMYILAAGYIACGISQALQGTLRGAGDTLSPMWITLLGSIGVRIPVAYGICFLTKSPELPQGSYLCIFISLLVAWVSGAVLSLIVYKKGKWRKKMLVLSQKASQE